MSRWGDLLFVVTFFFTFFFFLSLASDCTPIESVAVPGRDVYGEPEEDKPYLEQAKNFCKLKPPELEDELFYKQIFFAGCNVMTEQIQSLVQAHKASQAEEGEEQNEQTEEQLQDQ